MQLIKNIIDGIVKILLPAIRQTAIAFWDLFGIEDVLQNILIFWIILIFLSLTGTYISAKNKKTIKTIIFSFSDIILLFGAIIAYIYSK